MVQPVLDVHNYVKLENCHEQCEKRTHIGFGVQAVTNQLLKWKKNHFNKKCFPLLKRTCKWTFNRHHFWCSRNENTSGSHLLCLISSEGQQRFSRAHLQRGALTESNAACPQRVHHLAATFTQVPKTHLHVPTLTAPINRGTKADRPHTSAVSFGFPKFSSRQRKTTTNIQNKGLKRKRTLFTWWVHWQSVVC